MKDDTIDKALGIGAVGFVGFAMVFLFGLMVFLLGCGR